jgi:hypothetical protein
MSRKNSNDTIGNRTRDVPVCSVVPQPTTPPRAPVEVCSNKINLKIKKKVGYVVPSLILGDVYCRSFVSFIQTDDRTGW